ENVEAALRADRNAAVGKLHDAVAALRRETIAARVPFDRQIACAPRRIVDAGHAAGRGDPEFPARINLQIANEARRKVAGDVLEVAGRDEPHHSARVEADPDVAGP